MVWADCAVTAAARDVALIVLEDDLRGCVREAVKENGGKAAIKEQEMVTVLGRALRQ